MEHKHIEGYFFYSEKQRWSSKLGWQNPTGICAQAKLSNGDIVDYTEMNDTPKPFGDWDDYEHHGFGRVYSVHGVKQR